jgi:hypothetical protein
MMSGGSVEVRCWSKFTGALCGKLSSGRPHAVRDVLSQPSSSIPPPDPPPPRTAADWDCQPPASYIAPSHPHAEATRLLCPHNKGASSTHVRGPDLWYQMALVDNTVEQSWVSSVGDVSACTVLSVVSKAGGWGVGRVGCAARWSTSPSAAAPREHASPWARRGIKAAPAAWRYCWWRRGSFVPSWQHRRRPLCP